MYTGYLRVVLLAAVAVLMLSACSVADQEVGCTREIRMGLAVTATDGTTSEILGDFWAKAIDGSYVDSSYASPVSITPDVTPTAGLAGERAGVYMVVVSKDGYRPWSRDRVAVRQEVSECHVVPVSLQAVLTRNEYRDIIH